MPFLSMSQTKQSVVLTGLLVSTLYIRKNKRVKTQYRSMTRVDFDFVVEIYLGMHESKQELRSISFVIILSCSSLMGIDVCIEFC